MHWLIDARIFFSVNMEVYAAKQLNGSPYLTDNTVTAVVKRLMQPIDNYYTSVILANDLYTN